MSILGRVSEINQTIGEALRATQEEHWACVALGGMARWATSASIALAECTFCLALARFFSETRPSN
jgi:hypothetical protein